MLSDPVCGKRMQHIKAHAIVEHEGVAYHLCCPRCQAEFERSPQVYAKPAVGEKVKKTDRQALRRRRV